MSELGLFGDLDIASANDNPFYKPDDTYLCLITSAGVKKSQKGTRGWTIDYTIQEGKYKGRRIQEWKNIPWPWQVKGYETEEAMKNGGEKSEKIAEDADRDLSFLKGRLKDFGIPEEQMNSIQPAEIMDLSWLNVTMRNDDGREKITKVKLAGSNSSAEADPFA